MVALYARLLKLYPASFRARFGDEMLQFVRDEAALGRRVHWARTYADLLWSASAQGWQEKNTMKRYWPVAAVLLVTFLVARVFIGSGFTTETLLIMLAELGVVGLIIGIAALVSRATRGAEHDYSVRKFRWWWIVAGLLGAFQLLVMVGQLVHEPKKEHVFGLAVIGAFSALVFGGMAIGNRTTGNWMIAAGALPMVVVFWLVVPPLVALFVIVMAISDNIRMARTARLAV